MLIHRLSKHLLTFKSWLMLGKLEHKNVRKLKHERRLLLLLRVLRKLAPVPNQRLARNQQSERKR